MKFFSVCLFLRHSVVGDSAVSERPTQGREVPICLTRCVNISVPRVRVPPEKHNGVKSHSVNKSVHGCGTRRPRSLRSRQSSSPMHMRAQCCTQPGPLQIALGEGVYKHVEAKSDPYLQGIGRFEMILKDVSLWLIPSKGLARSVSQMQLWICL